MSNLSVLLIFLGLTFSNALVANEVKTTSATEQPSAQTKYQHIKLSFPSQATGVTYPVHVYVPNGYDDNKKDYPIIYATDGQWSKGHVKKLEAQHKEAIFVAIEQGPNQRRNIDYVLPGLQKYFVFLTQELLPSLEKTLRVDSTNRILLGTSLGGFFVNVAMLLEDPNARLFSTYLSYDASMFKGKAAINHLIKERLKTTNSMRVKLILTTATRQGNSKVVKAFHKKLQKAGFEGLTIERIDLPLTHKQVGGPSFDKSIQFIFPK